MRQNDTAPVKWLTVNEIAAQRGVKDSTVRAWITSGDLKAVNCSPKRDSQKPRYKISPEALAAFDRLRAAVPEPEPTRQRPRRRVLPRPLKEFV